MSMRTLESAITSEARRVFNKPGLRVKDFMECWTVVVEPGDGEVVETLPLNSVCASIQLECDKRRTD